MQLIAMASESRYGRKYLSSLRRSSMEQKLKLRPQIETSRQLDL
jgi:hypothetical protein